MLALHAHRGLIAATVLANVALAVWAFLVHLQGRRIVSREFWTVLLIAVAVMALQMAAGIVLTVAGTRPRTWLHFLYAVLVASVAMYQFGLRPGGFVRSRHAFWMGRDPHSPAGLVLICLLQAALMARAFTTGAFGR